MGADKILVEPLAFLLLAGMAWKLLRDEKTPWMRTILKAALTVALTVAFFALVLALKRIFA